VVTLAPRISRRLLAELERLDDGTVPFAELCRGVGAAADRFGLTRPSYERIRMLAHELRRRKRRPRPSTGEILADIALRTRPPEALVDHLAGVPLPRR
jgi:hypothetical protein